MQRRRRGRSQQHAAERDAEGAVRLRGGGATLLRPDGTATYQLASVADDLALGITHVSVGPITARTSSSSAESHARWRAIFRR